jgi:hypothetical protein
MPLKRAKRGRAAHRQTPLRSGCCCCCRCRSFSSRTARDSTKPPSSSSSPVASGVRCRCRRRRPSPPSAPRERGRNALVRPRAPDGRMRPNWLTTGPKGRSFVGVGDYEPNHVDRSTTSERGGPGADRANGNRSTSGASASPSRRSSHLARCGACRRRRGTSGCSILWQRGERRLQQILNQVNANDILTHRYYYEFIYAEAFDSNT